MRILILIFSTLLVLGISACTDDDKSKKSSSSTPSTNNAVPTLKMSCGDNDCIQ